MTMILDGTNGAFLPTWTTATRPASPANGEIGYNSTTGQLDQYVSGAWSSVPTSSATQAVANGGTGQTTYTNGQLLIGNTTGNTLTKTTLTAGSGITITNGSGAITIASSGGSAATPNALGTVYASTLDLSGNATTAVGYQACRVDVGSSNTAFGATALYTNTTGARSVAVGYGALYTNNGNENVAIGVSALQLNTSGLGNTAIGTFASASNLTASYNTSVGYSALQLTTTGASNVAIGTSANYNNTTGAFNIAIGRDSLTNNRSGDYNTAIGYQALVAANSPASNTCIGAYAGSLITTGYYNTFIGYNSGSWSGGAITTGTQNISIGFNTGGSSTSVTGTIVLGTSTSADRGTSTGFINPNSGGVYQGNNSAAWSVSSDQRLKKNIVDNNVGLDKVVQIQVRNFEYRTEDEVTELPKHSVIKKEGVQLGVIAQELQAILPDCVKTESTGVMSVDSTDIMYHMINAIKELSAEVNALKAKVGA